MRVADTQDGKVRSIDCVSRKHFGGSMLKLLDHDAGGFQRIGWGTRRFMG